MLTQESVRSQFYYCAVTGILTRKWKMRIIQNAPQSGDARYATVKVDGKTYKVHQVVWVWCYGPLPDGMVIDHINNERSDNRIENLRAITQRDNLRNRSMNSNNKSRFKGVRASGKKFMAICKDNGKGIYLGTFETEEEAARAFDKKLLEIHGRFANTNERAGRFNNNDEPKRRLHIPPAHPMQQLRVL